MLNEKLATVEDARKIQLNILKHVDRICKDNQINYWLDCGTLLGAVRHAGYIPWDDDIDISMLRSDYCKFKLVCKRELPSEFFLQDYDTDVDYSGPIKIRHVDSYYEERHKEKLNHRKGIFVDVFPVDYRPDNRFAVSLQKIIYLIFSIFIEKKKTNQLNLGGRRFKFFFQIVFSFVNFFGRVLGVNKCMEIGLFITHKFNRLSKKRCCTYGFENYTSYKRSFFVDDIFPLSEVRFEGEYYPAPRNAGSHLIEIYGESYMELPPKENRVMHADKIIINKFPS